MHQWPLHAAVRRIVSADEILERGHLVVTIESELAVAVPEQGNLVRVRDRFWVVESVKPSTLPADPLSAAGSIQHHLVRLVPIDDKGSSEPLTVFWETEPGTEIRPQAGLPDPAAGLDVADTFGAFLDAARWGDRVGDPSAFQSPFRAGIDIEDYQLLPLVEALRMPRLPADCRRRWARQDDRSRPDRSGACAPEPGTEDPDRLSAEPVSQVAARDEREVRARFEVVDTEYVHRLRRERGVGVNPFRSHPRLIVSTEWVKFESQMRWFDEFLPPAAARRAGTAGSQFANRATSNSGRPAIDSEWPRILEMHALNVLRFLKASNSAIGASALEFWPPSVVGVQRLSVQAVRAGEVIDEWSADAHLDTPPGALSLFISGDVNPSSVVDAIATAFGVDRGKKSLLLNVLRSSSAEAGSAELDWEHVATLSDAESAYFYEHRETRVEFRDSSHELPPLEPCLEVPGGLISPTDPVVWEPSELARRPRSMAPPIPAMEEHPLPPTRSMAHPRSSERSPRGERPTSGSFRAAGVSVVYDLAEETQEVDYQPEAAGDDDGRDEERVCLSYYDVAHGMLPIDGRVLKRLTTGRELHSVLLFGEPVPARPSDPDLSLEDGAMLFGARAVVPGTIVRLLPATPGSIEAVIRPETHRVDGVWMLELDERGLLIRLRQDDLELQWETDDAFYRAERRLEDIEALMKDGGKWAVQLVIEVFLSRPNEGLTADDVWGLVAISRLFAKSTISQVLSQQSGLFEHRDGLWYMTGDEMRMKVRTQVPRSASRPTERPAGTT